MASSLLSLVARRQLQRSIRKFSDATIKPVRRQVSMEERAANRAARKDRANKLLAQARGGNSTGAGEASSGAPAIPTKYVWLLGVGIPTVILFWGYQDENSPPAKLAKAIGLTDWTDQFAQPSHDKLLPDWSQMPNVPQDIPIPPTLVLDLENTLVSSTWDRRYGWRHAKRPGVDKFLHDMAQYYEIVLYSPSIDAIAEPVVNNLDKSGCIMHRLYRDATYFKDGVHVKDLNRLNRNVNKMIVLDDDPEAVSFNPENLIRVKPYTDPMDQDDDTLERITPFLIEIAREGYSDVPSILRQYQGMDADEIADEHARRIEQFTLDRRRKAQRGLGALVRRDSDNLPPPELSPTPTGATQQLTSKDLVGAAPPPTGGGMLEWLHQRSKEKEDQQMRKMEKWNEVMLKKQEARREQERQQQQQQQGQN